MINHSPQETTKVCMLKRKNNYYQCVTITLLAGLILLGTQSFAQARLALGQLWVENKSNPLGVTEAAPRLSWTILSDGFQVVQTAYEIRVATNEKDLQRGRHLIWESGKINTDQSIHVPYKGSALRSAQRYYWQVKVWDNQGHASDWSTAGFWQTGLLSASDWKAKWIEPGYAGDAVFKPSPMLRKGFTTGKKIASATAFITAHGLYEAFINGKKIGNAFLTPGWTDYTDRLQYQSYDVTDLIKQGNNAIGVLLGSGWYRSPMAWGDNINHYGKKLGLLFQLEITYVDGSHRYIISDGSWKSSTGEIVYSEIYNGETIDARLKKTGWTLPDYKDAAWVSVHVKDYGFKNLITTENQLVTKHEVFHPVKVITTPKGEKVLDFGQNLVGWVVATLSGKAGDTVTISHAEVLDKAGNFYTANLRAAKAQDHYILNGDENEVFEPHFTWHGFRYIKVEGLSGNLNPDDFTAVTLYSDMPQTGHFSSSDTMLNKLEHNIEWGLRGNFLDIPTDCPQRDERLGWTGDAQVFSRTASFIRNVNSFFDKWMKDVAVDQFKDGRIPHVVPNVLGPDQGGSAGWADVATIIPWNMYVAYGDKRILENQYTSMKAWVDYIKGVSKDDLWNTGFDFGDWLFYRPDDDNDGRAAVTDKYLIAQCFYAHSTQLLINAAKVLGKTADVQSYTALLKKIKSAFVREYMTPSGRLVSGTQTAYVLALNFDMLPEHLRVQAANRLVENIHSYGDHITTGFLGTPYISEVLTRFGHTDVAYKLLLQKIYPSWLYPVTQGATTIWERWDGQKPDGSFENPGMNSFNHYAYGAIGDWMYREMVGLDTYEGEEAVGYKHIKIQPHIGGGIQSAEASQLTYYGKLSCSWEVKDELLSLKIKIPVNTEATIFIPTNDATRILCNAVPIKDIKGLTVVGEKAGYLQIKTGSGNYNFSSTITQTKEK